MKFLLLERFPDGQAIYGAEHNGRNYVIAFNHGRWTASYLDNEKGRPVFLIDWDNSVQSYEEAKQRCEDHARQ